MAHDHANRVALVVVVDLVGELTDQKQTASVNGFDAIGTGGIGYGRRVEPIALVLYTNSNGRVVDVNGHVDALGGVELVAVHDGVRQGFTQGDTHLEPRSARCHAACHTVACYEVYGFFDNIEIGGHPKANLNTAPSRFRHPRFSAPNEQPERSGGDLRSQRSLPP